MDLPLNLLKAYKLATLALEVIEQLNGTPRVVLSPFLLQSRVKRVIFGALSFIPKVLERFSDLVHISYRSCWHWLTLVWKTQT
jgi:hypothetical protein